MCLKKNDIVSNAEAIGQICDLDKRSKDVRDCDKKARLASTLARLSLSSPISSYGWAALAPLMEFSKARRYESMASSSSASQTKSCTNASSDL